MATVQTLEAQIAETEGFDVHVVHPSGRRVRSDTTVPAYPYERAARQTFTVAHWTAKRFRDTYPDFEVRVLNGETGQAAHGRTLLSRIRGTY